LANTHVEVVAALAPEDELVEVREAVCFEVHALEGVEAFRFLGARARAHAGAGLEAVDRGWQGEGDSRSEISVALMSLYSTGGRRSGGSRIWGEDG
jgi:hypothetical protein